MQIAKNHVARYRTRAMLPVIFFGLVGCVYRAPQDGQLKELVADPRAGAGNVALLFGEDQAGTINELAGVKADLKNMEDILRWPDNGFETTKHDGLDKAALLKATTDAAANVPDDGTLLWYYSGHGVEDGRLVPRDALTVSGEPNTALFISGEDLYQALRNARQGRPPLARLVVILDSCFSGQWVWTGKQSTFFSRGFGAGVGTEVAREVFVLAGAREKQTAADLGLKGGALTFAFATAMKAWRGNDSATVGDLLKTTGDNIPKSLGQSIKYEAFPTEVIFGSPLWIAGIAATQQPHGTDSRTTTCELNVPNGEDQPRVDRFVFSSPAVVGSQISWNPFGLSGPGHGPGLTIQSSVPGNCPRCFDIVAFGGGDMFKLHLRIKSGALTLDAEYKTTTGGPLDYETFGAGGQCNKSVVTGG